MGRLARRHKQKRRDLKIAPFLSVNGGRYKDRTCDPFHVKATLELREELGRPGPQRTPVHSKGVHTMATHNKNNYKRQAP